MITALKNSPIARTALRTVRVVRLRPDMSPPEQEVGMGTGCARGARHIKGPGRGLKALIS
jgi:hypothetical protein